jgi:hypothetical protein
MPGFASEFDQKGEQSVSVRIENRAPLRPPNNDILVLPK